MSDISMPHREAAFCLMYMIERKPRKAAILAGYGPGHAGDIAKRLLVDPKIKQRIKDLEKAYRTKTAITPKKVLKELASIAFANVADFFQWDEDGVRLIPSDDLLEHQTAAISGIKETRRESFDKEGKKKVDNITLEVKFHSKTDALDKLSRHLGIYEDTVKIDPGKALVEMMKQVDGVTHGKLPSDRGD